MKRARFEALVRKALAGLPAEVRGHLDSVEVVVLDHPSRELLLSLDMDPEEDTLLGFYDGVPITERFEHQDATPIPVRDTIMIFQEPLEEMCESDDELLEEIRITVVHEVAHHLGLDDDRVDELGYG